MLTFCSHSLTGETEGTGRARSGGRVSSSPDNGVGDDEEGTTTGMNVSSSFEDLRAASALRRGRRSSFSSKESEDVNSSNNYYHAGSAMAERRRAHEERVMLAKSKSPRTVEFLTTFFACEEALERRDALKVVEKMADMQRELSNPEFVHTNSNGETMKRLALSLMTRCYLLLGETLSGVQLPWVTAFFNYETEHAGFFIIHDLSSKIDTKSGIPTTVSTVGSSPPLPWNSALPPAPRRVIVKHLMSIPGIKIDPSLTMMIDETANEAGKNNDDAEMDEASRRRQSMGSPPLSTSSSSSSSTPPASGLATFPITFLQAKPPSLETTLGREFHPALVMLMTSAEKARERKRLDERRRRSSSKRRTRRNGDNHPSMTPLDIGEEGEEEEEEGIAEEDDGLGDNDDEDDFSMGYLVEDSRLVSSSPSPPGNYARASSSSSSSSSAAAMTSASTLTSISATAAAATTSQLAMVAGVGPTSATSGTGGSKKNKRPSALMSSSAAKHPRTFFYRRLDSRTYAFVVYPKFKKPKDDTGVAAFLEYVASFFDEI